MQLPKRCTTLARKLDLVRYPDGTSKHISNSQRDSLLLSSEIEFLCAGEYRSTLELRSFRFNATQNTLNRLEDLAASPDSPLALPHKNFLPGNFIIEAPDKRKRREVMETPEHMAIRLLAQVNRG